MDYAEFRLYSGTVVFNMPLVLEKMPLESLKKFFRYIDMRLGSNKETADAFFSCIPELSADLKQAWDDASIKFQREYKSEEYNRHHKANNKKLFNAVKTAKADYERFQKRIPKLEEIKNQYVY